MSLKRLFTAFNMTLREFLRRRGMLAFMVAIPVVSFASVYVALPDTPVSLDAIENGVKVQVDLDQVALFGGVMALIYVAIMAGISGFYVMSSATRSDRRLILAGCTPFELVASRCMVLLVISVGIMVLQFIIMAFFFTPKQIFPYALSLFWSAMVYGIYGGFFATIIRNELGGLLAVVFFANFDVGYFQLPGYSNFIDEWWLKILPGYYPVQLAIDAGFTSVPDLFWESFLTIPHSLVIAGFMLGAYNRVTRVRPFLETEGRPNTWRIAGLAAVVLAILAGIGGYFYWSSQPAVVSVDGRIDATNAKILATTVGRVSLIDVEEGSRIERGAIAAWIENEADGTLAQLSSPLSGTVTSLEVEQGENVVAGDVVAEVYQTDSLVASLEVDENQISGVAIGQKVLITSGSLNWETDATVTKIALTPLPPDPTLSERTRKIRKYVVECRLSQPDPRLLVGMAVKGKIFLDGPS